MSLVLSRRIGETIRIDDDISITIVQCTSGQAKLSINAPKYVRVDREEVYLRKQREKNLAQTTTQAIHTWSSQN